MKKSKKKKPTWSDLKRQLAEFDRTALLGLIQDLYAAGKNSQTFLHARFALVENVLEPYKATIDRWVCPDVMLNQDQSQEGDFRLQESHRTSRGYGGADRVLLRVLNEPKIQIISFLSCD